MGYMHIENLYSNTEILEHKECYAMEKIHGTSAHISYKEGNINFFAGGSKHETFVALFNAEELKKKIESILDVDHHSVHIYGEAYGGKLQGMSHTYGPDLRFVAFEVKIGDRWMSVETAEDICLVLGLDFVHYVRIPTTLEAIDRERDAPSVQAKKCGILEDRIREGVVLRPIEETVNYRGNRVIAKHKRDEFRETHTPRKVGQKLEQTAETKKIVEEWVTEERLRHVLDELPLSMSCIGEVIGRMVDDIRREGSQEVILTPESVKAIGRQTALMIKRKLNEALV